MHDGEPNYPRNEASMSAMATPKVPTVREVLQRQQVGAAQERQDLETVLNMLPSQMTWEQEQAFRRLFLRDLTFPFSSR